MVPPSAEVMAFAASVEQKSESSNNNSAAAAPKDARKRCCVKGCKNHVNLQRVSPYPKPLPQGASKDRQITQAKRIFKREEYLERLGRSRQDKAKDLRFCANHKMELQKFVFNVNIMTAEGILADTVAVSLECLVPINVTIKPALHGMRKRCCVKNCRNHMALQRVPPYPKDIPLGSSKARQITRAKKIFKRNEWMKRLGYSVAESHKHPDVRLCPNHRMQMKNWTFTVPILDELGNETETVELAAQFEVPVGIVPDADVAAATPAAAAAAPAAMQEAPAASAFYDPLASFEDRKEPAQSTMESTAASAAGSMDEPLQTAML